PTLEKWLLGRRLFFDRELLRSGGGCTLCHQPDQAFTTLADVKLEQPRMRTLSLVNCVYNKQQFWDGRADALEQVLQRDLQDEQLPQGRLTGAQSPQVRHVWGGVVQRLVGDPDYVERFRDAFGIEKPTQDAVAKALATYLRTILSGNSLYDRAVAA